MIRDLGIEIGVEVDESPLADVNQEIDEITRALRGIDVRVLDQMEREAQALTGDFDNVTRRIDHVDDSLQNIDIGSLEQISSESGSASRALDLLEVGALAVSAAIGAIALSVGTFATETDVAFGKLSAQTGAAGEELQILESAAEDVFARGYGENLEEVTDAISRVKQNIHSLNEEDLDDVTADAMLLASVFDSDVNEIARGVNNTMEAFGVSADKAFDLFTAGSQRGLNFSNELFDNVAEYAPLFGMMGYTAEEYFGILERGSKAGVYNLDYVNDIMKEFQIRVKDGSKATNEAMGDLSKETRDVWKSFLEGESTVSDVASTVVDELKGMDDQVLANQIAVGLFGTKFEDLESDAVYAMLGTTEAMKGFEGATDAAAEAVENTFKNRMVGAWRDLQIGISEVVEGSAAIGFLDSIATKIEELVPIIVGSVDAVFEFAGSFKEFEFVKNTIEVLSEYVDILVNQYLVPLMPVAEEIVASVMSFIGGVIEGTTSVFMGLWSIIEGLFNNVIVPLFPVMQEIITVAFQFINPILELAGSLFDAVASIVRFLVEEVVVPLFPLVTATIETAWAIISPILSALADAFDVIVDSVDWALEKITSFFDYMSNMDAGKLLGSIASGAGDVLGSVFGFETGLGRVPYDNMPAYLHKDEAVLQAENADALRDAGILKGDGRHPEIDLTAANQQVSDRDIRIEGPKDYRNEKIAPANNQTSVHAPVNIYVQGGNTNEETGQSVRDVMEEFFADLTAVMPQVREG